MGGGFRSRSTEMGDLQRKYPMIKLIKYTKVKGGKEIEGGRLTRPPR
jgi:hypothetical protein